MKLLAIESATENCSVALGLEGEVTERSEVIPNGHSGKVHAMIRDLLQEQSIELNQLDAIAVDIGPGSFTGVRIGIGIAQGLAFASGLPVVGVSSLAALAKPYQNSLVLTAIDARMGQVYWCLFDVNGSVTPLLAPAVSNPGEVSKHLVDVVGLDVRPDSPVYAAGSGWKAYRDLMPAEAGNKGINMTGDLYPQAINILGLAESGTLQNPALLQASYVRNDVAKKSVSR